MAVVALLLPLPLSGCDGVQSALLPSGREALAIDPLFWLVTGISVATTVMVTLVTAVALWGPERWRAQLGRTWVVWGGGIVLPTVVLSALLVYGLLVLDAGGSRSTEASGPGITVVGKRWWWEVVYEGAGGEKVVSANEIRLPVGRPVPIRLESDNVIHSFWVPRLAGKLDMIPGRTNVLTLEATEPGVSRGQCAEYCGGAHALMSFYVVAMPLAEYDEWLRNEASAAREPRTEEQRRGKTLFLQNGCGACHTIRGTDARGTIAPDLTHVGSRMSLASAVLPNNAEAFARWIIDNQHIKPENLMPAFHYLTPEELAAMGAYLDSLD